MRSSISSEDKAGLYITIIVHLVVILILLVTQIGTELSKENTFVLDFTKQEEIERKAEEEKAKAEEEAFDEEIARRLDELLSGSTAVPFRNVAVDRSSALKDDRGTDAEKLYEDAMRLAQELKGGVTPDEPDDSFAALSPVEDKKDNKGEAKQYSGPSVVSYDLEGRKASHLSVPAYRCMGGGMVTVAIGVDRQGTVVSAKIEDALSSTDKCLRDYAIRAARLSKFSKSTTAPTRQAGNIVYQFIAQ